MLREDARRAAEPDPAPSLRERVRLRLRTAVHDAFVVESRRVSLAGDPRAGRYRAHVEIPEASEWDMDALDRTEEGDLTPMGGVPMCGGSSWLQSPRQRRARARYLAEHALRLASLEANG